MEPRISIITLGVRSLERSYNFYKTGLGFPTSMNPDEGIVFFRTSGVCLALYPEEKLAADVGPNFKAGQAQENRFPGITLAHNTRTREEVDELIKKADTRWPDVKEKIEHRLLRGYRIRIAGTDVGDPIRRVARPDGRGGRRQAP